MSRMRDIKDGESIPSVLGEKKSIFKKKGGGIRIVCLWESETFGCYESQDKEGPSQKVEKRKDYAGKYVLPLKPDIMIIFHQIVLEYVNDSIRGIEGKDLANKSRGKGLKNPDSEPTTVSAKRALSKAVGFLMRCLPEGPSTQHRLRELRRRIRKKEASYP